MTTNRCQSIQLPGTQAFFIISISLPPNSCMINESDNVSFTAGNLRTPQGYTPRIPILEVLRWTALVFSGLTIVGLMYADGLPVSMESAIMKKFKVNDAQYNLIFTLGGIPTLFMPIVGGYMTDYFGCRLMMFLGLTIVTLGQGLMCLACYNGGFMYLILGKLVEMLAWDTMYISRYKMICSLFYEKHLTIAIGLDTLFITFSGIANQMLSPYVYNRTGELGTTWFVGFSICIVSWICTLGFIYFDKKVEDREKEIRIKTAEPTKPKVEVKLQDFLKLGRMVWMISFAYALSYGTYNVLLGNINVFLQRKFGFDNQGAGNMTTTYSYTYQTVMLITSFLLDKFGRRALAIQIATIATFCAILSFQLLPGSDVPTFTPILPLILLGLFIGIYTVTCFPCLTFLVKPELLGLAFGISSLTNNVMVVALPYVFGSIVEASKIGDYYSYTPVMIFLLVTSGLGIILASFVGYLDRRMKEPLSQLKPEDALKLFESKNPKFQEDSSLGYYGGVETSKEQEE